MTVRKDTRSFSSSTTSSFEKVGPGMATIDNVSGAPSPYTELQPRDSSPVAAQPCPCSACGAHRAAVMIDAQSGQHLGDMTEQSAAVAARHLSIEETVTRCHPAFRSTLEHLFGMNLPGRGRA